MLAPPTLAPTPPPNNVVRQILRLAKETSVGIFLLIFSFLGVSEDYERFLFRRLCTCFALCFQKPSGIYTTFPHPKYSSLTKLMKKLNKVYKRDPSKAPTLLFVMEGTFYVGKKDSNKPRYIVIKYPLHIIGAGRKKTFIQGGGFSIQGKQEIGKSVALTRLTVDGACGNGIFAHGGLFFSCKSVTLSKCRENGVFTGNTKGRLTNCVIELCGHCGIYSREALLELEGSQTKVDSNGTNDHIGRVGAPNHYGLCTSGLSVDNLSVSLVHMLYPLTRESVSTNNSRYTELRHPSRGGGVLVKYRNYGGEGTICTVHSLESTTLWCAEESMVKKNVVQTE